MPRSRARPGRTAALALAIGGAAFFANGAIGAGATTDGPLANDFNEVTRSTAWNQVDKLHLNFQTYHTEAWRSPTSTSSCRPCRSSSRRRSTPVP